MWLKPIFSLPATIIVLMSNIVFILYFKNKQFSFERKLDSLC